MVRRKFQTVTKFSQVGSLLIHILAGAFWKQPRDPEHKAIDGWLIGEIPVLKVLEVLAARAGLRRVMFQGIAIDHAVAERG
ncbi:MAG TPA: hypothetical protein DEB73_02435 [Candidatus Magasanikbacteria bacterium]|nr:hypothetical protein [Candidatus Magasanikbacteria bacterium]